MKILRLFTILLVLMNSMILFANGQSNTMSIKDTSTLAGGVLEVSLEVTNDDEFVGFQLDIPLHAIGLDDPFVFVDNSFELSDRADGHIFSAVTVANDVLRILAFHPNEATPFQGDEGVIATFQLQTPEEPGTYMLEIVDGIITDDEGELLPLVTMGGEAYLVGNELRIRDTSVFINQELTVEVEIENYQEFTGFDFEVLLPDGFSFVEDSETLFRGTNHFIEAIPSATENKVRFLSASLSNDLFLDDEDLLILTFDLEVDPDQGGDYYLEILNPVISDVDGINILTEAFNGYVLVYDYNEMFVQDDTGLTNTVHTLALEIDNTMEFVGFQADIHIPDGIVYQDVIQLSDRAGNHQITGVMIGDDVLRITAFSPTNEMFEDFDGAVAYFDVLLPNDPDLFEFEITNAVISNIEGDNILTNVETGVLNVVVQAELAIDDTNAYSGQNVTVDLLLLNSQDVVAFQTKVIIPGGFTYVDGSAAMNPGRSVDHTLTATLDGNELTLISFSMSNAAYLDEEGDVILSFELLAPADVVPTDYVVEIDEDFTVVTDWDDENETSNNIMSAVTAGVITVAPEEIATLAELRARPQDGAVYHFVGEGVLVAQDGFRNRKFLQDETAAILIDDQPGTITTDYNLYDVVTGVVGKINIFNNFVQYQPELNAPAATQNTPVEPLLLGIDEITADDQAKLVRFENVTYTGITDGQVFANGQEYSITDGVNNFIMRADFWHVDYIGEEIPTTPLNMNGVIIERSNGRMIVPRFADDFYVYPELTLEVEPEGAGTVTGDGYYDIGEEVTLSATALEGYEFQNWRKNGSVISSDEEFVFVMPDYPVTIVAHFVVTDTELYTISLQANPEAGGTLTGGGAFEAGETVVAIATPNTGYRFVAWLEGNTIVSQDPTYSFEVEGDRSLVANFALRQYTVTISGLPENNVGGGFKGGGKFTHGTEITVVARPNMHYDFLAWIEEEEVVSEDLEYTFTVVANHQLIAHFIGETYDINVVADPDEGGTVSGSGHYWAGDAVKAEAAPADGYFFLRWMDEDQGQVSLQNPYYFTANNDRNLTAEFWGPVPAGSPLLLDNNMVTVTASVVPEGTGLVFGDGFNPITGQGTYPEGTEVTLTASPNVGIDFVHWMIGDDIVGTDLAYTFTADENTDLIAVFDGDTYTVSVEADPEDGGEPTVSNDGEFFFGEFALLNANTNLGWEFINWTTVDDIQVSVLPDYGFTVTDDIHLIANFEELDEFTLTLMADPADAGTVTGGGSFEDGTEVTINAVENPGYTFTYWGLGTDIFSEDSEVTFVIDEDLTLVAYFQINSYTLTLNADPIEGGDVFGAGVYLFNETVDVDAVPNEGWEFVEWTDGDGNFVSDQAFNEITIPADDLTLIANFAMIDYTLTLIANPADGGVVTGAGTYNFEDEVDVDAIPNEGWVFVNWTDVDGNEVSDQPDNTITMPSDDLTLTANFEMIDYTLTLIANPTEGGIVTGEGVYNFGDEVDVDAIPNEGWAFVNWTDVDGNEVSDQPDNTITMPSDDLTLTANFEMIDYTLTLVANPADGGVVTGAGTYNFEDEVDVDAIPNEGWVFVNWTDVDGNEVSDQPDNTITMPSDDLTLTANFEMIDYTLTLIANPTEGGDVTGAGVYNFGDEVDVDAIPNEGWAFVNWTDVDGNEVSDQPDNTITMPAADLTLTANFEMVDYTLTLIANPTEGGDVTGAGVYNFGDEVDVDAIPNEGWAFVNWTDADGNEVSDQPDNTITMPAADLTLTANFEMIDYTLTLVAEPAEGGNVTGAGVYNFGDLVNVDAIPNAGWAFVEWTDGDGNFVSDSPDNTISMPAADVTLVAHFELITYTLTFVVQDSATEDPITDAQITLNGVTYDPGVYVFEGLLPDSYTYVVSREDYFDSDGVAEIVDEDLLVIVNLDIDDTSVGEVEVLDLSLFPNPASSVLTVESNITINEIRMIDMLGKVVYNASIQSQYHDVDVSSLKNGIYFVQVYTEQGVVTHRVQVSK